MHLRRKNPLPLKRHLFPHGDGVKIQVQGLLDLGFDNSPHLEYFSNFSSSTLKRHLLKRRLTLSECKRWLPDGGSSFVWRANSRTPFNRGLISLLPLFYLKFALNSIFLPLTPAQPTISTRFGNHSLQTLGLVRKTREGCNCLLNFIWKMDTLQRRLRQVNGSVDPRFVAGLPFPVPEVPEV